MTSLMLVVIILSDALDKSDNLPALGKLDGEYEESVLAMHER